MIKFYPKKITGRELWNIWITVKCNKTYPRLLVSNYSNYSQSDADKSNRDYQRAHMCVRMTSTVTSLATLRQILPLAYWATRCLWSSSRPLMVLCGGQLNWPKRHRDVSRRCSANCLASFRCSCSVAFWWCWGFCGFWAECRCIRPCLFADSDIWWTLSRTFLSSSPNWACPCCLNKRTASWHSWLLDYESRTHCLAEWFCIDFDFGAHLWGQSCFCYCCWKWDFRKEDFFGLSSSVFDLCYQRRYFLFF